jgi:hypothetical protein
MKLTIHDIIRITAEAIQGGIKPYKLIENPAKILSGNTKKIVISKHGEKIRLGENIIDRLIELGETIDKTKLTWKQHLGIPGPDHRYTEWTQRDTKSLIDLVESGETDRLGIVEVPIEDWSWVVLCTDDIYAREYIHHLI